MCFADTTPYPIKADPVLLIGARADFSPHRKCRRFDQKVDRMTEHIME